ncbi:MAG: hypothetical protein ACR2II_13685 [Chthoniobacterales bacterium]
MILLTRASFASITISSWDAASEFNDCANPDAANPSGVWSYGWKKTLTDKFFLAMTPVNDPPFRFGWCNASGFPQISHTNRTVPSTGSGVNSGAFAPHALALHPGLNGEYAVVRFTAPADGTYKASGQFYALDDHATGTTTDVWILANDEKTGAFSGRIDYYGGVKWASFTSTVFQLKKGNTLDFQVGYGANKNYEYDSTGLVALIQMIK